MIDCTVTCLSVLARGEIPNSNRVVHRARGKERMSVRAMVAWGERSASVRENAKLIVRERKKGELVRVAEANRLNRVFVSLQIGQRLLVCCTVSR
jgi:hypothetical protein